MDMYDNTGMSEILGSSIQIINGAANDYDDLMRQIGAATIVLLGEATHGTQEFYQERVRITQRLIQEKGFTVVAVEADWPDAYQVNQYIQGVSRVTLADEALSGFKRFPAWMWRNQDVLAFVEWLYQFNRGREEVQKIGFYGLDLYSLHASMEVVISYLSEVDPDAAQEARLRYGCFDNMGEDLQNYGFLSSHGLIPSCEDAMVSQVIDLQRHAMEYPVQGNDMAEKAFFNAEQNARLAKSAERYYRSMFSGHMRSWNLRDTHMFETLDNLVHYLSRQTRQTKVVVWAHNSHIGDARATEMGAQGELNVGQLVREKYGNQTFSIGFGTYMGTVTAASDWGAPAEVKQIRPALPGSYETLFHHTGVPSFLLNLRNPDLRETLHRSLLERAIGVIYRPETERQSHYFKAKLTEQFDAFIHIDQTHAVEPLEKGTAWNQGELPETFPSSF